MWDPFLFNLDQFPDTMGQFFGIEFGKTGSSGGNQHPGHVVHRPEHPDLVINASVGLHSFKQLLSIVKDLENLEIISN